MIIANKINARYIIYNLISHFKDNFIFTAEAGPGKSYFLQKN
jgi:hypothetical protein